MFSVLNCPFCAGKVFADDEFAFRHISCPHCYKEFAGPPPLPDLSPAKTESVAASTFPIPVPVPVPVEESESTDDGVQFSANGEIRVRWNSVAEAKLAIKKLKLLKKQASSEKKAATTAQRMIRAEYTQRVRQRGSKVRGGGWVGKFVRGIQTVSRDAERANLANQLAPWEAKKNQCDRIILQLENLILQVESKLAG